MVRKAQSAVPKSFNALVLLAVLLVGACSSGTSSDRSANDAPEGILRIGVERPQSLDPAQARSPSEFLLAEQLFDGLTTFDPVTHQAQPAVAASWESSPDMKAWNFTIRPDAKFGNGRPITADDVKYTLERIARKGSQSPAATQLELIGGFKPFNITGKAANLAGVVVPAPNVVHIAVDQPLAVLPEILGNPMYGIVPREAVEAQAPSPPFDVQPVGSGPFVLQSRTETVLHLVPAPDRNVTLRGVDAYMARDPAGSYAAFLRGGLDWAEVPPDQVEPVPEKRGRDTFGPYAAELFYGFNLKNPKFKDQRFRQAIVQAIDREAIVRLVYGGSVRPSSGLVADGVPGYQPNACGDRCAYNPERARQLVAEAFGGKPPPQIQIDFDDNPTQSAVAQAMQANLRDVGIPSALRPHPYGDYLRFALGGQQELFRLGWIGSHPSPDAFLTPLFQSGMSDNITGFSSPPVDQLLSRARAEPDPQKRFATYQEAEKLVMDQVPVLPIAQFQIHTVVSTRVENLNMSILGTFDASQVRLTG
ncbi:MAG: ABC transporter substrate-binding protein [Actinomycetota bacterium]|nr:ABC transporter substrate-binding protein [Actinomycetota bacterium]